MKKWIALSVAILVVGLYAMWPKASLDTPILMSTQLNEKTKTVAVSYLVQKNDDTFLMQIGQDTTGFYPPRTNGNWDGTTNFTQVLETQNGYELREDIIELSEDQYTYLLSKDSHTLPIQVSFKNYSPIETTLVLISEEESVAGTKKEQTLRYTYTSPKDENLDSIGHYDSVGTISFEQNGQEAVFPLALKKGETVDITFYGAYKLSSSDSLLLELVTTDNHSIWKNVLLTERIPEGYLKQVANES